MKEKMNELIGKELNEEVIEKIKQLENEGFVVTVVANKVFAIEEQEY